MPAWAIAAATAASDTQVDLAWTDNATTETGYRVERCTGASCTIFTDTLTTALGVDAVSYSDLTVVENTTYRYRVFATNSGGDSGASNEDQETTNVDSV